MIRYMLVAVAIAAMLAACTKKVYVPQTRTQIIIDTLLETRADSATIAALLECDSNGMVLVRELNHLKGELAKSQLSIKDNLLESKVKWRTKVVERTIEIRDTITLTKQVEVVKQVKHIPKLYRYSLWLVIGVVALGCGRLVWWLAKKLA